MGTEDRIRQLEAEVAELRALLEQRLPPPGDQRTVASPEDPPRTSRRAMLRLAGASAVGAVGAVVVAQAAAATDGLTITGGSATSTANLTQVNYTGGGTTGDAFVFAAGAGSGVASSFPAVVAGKTNGVMGNGVYGTSNVIGGAGVVGETTTSSGAGVLGITTLANSFGVQGQSTGASGTAGFFFGVTGINTTGTTAPGITATSTANIGGTFSGARAALKVIGAGTPPPLRGALSPHLQGEIDSDVNGDLWYCTNSGSPGRWVKIGGPATAGAFHALTPGRVYDTRRLAPGLAPISMANGPYTLTVSTRFDNAGNILQANFVPAGATAVTANVTVTNTVGSGFLAIVPGGTSPTGASSTINWFASGQTLANGVTLKLNSTRQLTAGCGTASSSTHFIVDVTGYYL